MPAEQRGKVSVALATYNGAAFLRAQLDSLFAQTYGDLEVVAVDDGSTDGTLAILEDYARRRRLVLHRNARNLGFLRNFERAIELCNGDFIALADQDDVWLPHKVEALLARLGDSWLVYSDARLIDGDGRELDSKLSDLQGLRLARGRTSLPFVLYNCASGNTALFTRELASRALPIPAGVRFHDAWLAFVAAALGAIDFVDEPLTLYRRHERNVTRKDPPRDNRAAARGRRRDERRIELLGELRCRLALDGMRERDRAVLGEFAHLLERSRGGYFDIGLAAFLARHRAELFALQRRKKCFKRIARLATGERLRRMQLSLGGKG